MTDFTVINTQELNDLKKRLNQSQYKIDQLIHLLNNVKSDGMYIYCDDICTREKVMVNWFEHCKTVINMFKDKEKI